MKMFRVFMLFLTMIFVVPAWAEAVDVSNLTPTQLAELKGKISTQEKANQQSGTSTIEAVSQWATLGKNIGQGLVGAAHEMGVAVNEFSQSDVGKMVTFLLVWHFFGKTMILTAMLFLIPLVFAPLVLSSVKKSLCEFTNVTTEHKFAKLTWTSTHRDYTTNEVYYIVTVISYCIFIIAWSICLVNV